MRTTVRLPDDLYRAVKLRAAERGVTVTALLEEGLRLVLAREATAEERATYRVDPLPTGNGVQPGVDLDDSAALLDRMEGT